jgi:hypothetical protein
LLCHKVAEAMVHHRLVLAQNNYDSFVYEPMCNNFYE